MADRDPWSGAETDDWFAEPEPPSTRRSRLDEEARTEERLPSPDDDWLKGAEPSRARRPQFGSSSTTRRAVVGIAGGLVVLFASLALAGVFSSSKRTPATQSTTTARTTTTRPAATTLPAPTATLKPGDRGAQVRVLQRALASLGYSTGTIDGFYGNATKAAVTKFQQDNRLTADGVLGPKTLAALATALRKNG